MPFNLRKLRNQNLYKIFNVESGEIIDHIPSKKEARKKLRQLRKIEKKKDKNSMREWEDVNNIAKSLLKRHRDLTGELKDLKGGSINSDILEEMLKESYNDKLEDIEHYKIDPELSTDRVKVYVNEKNNKVYSVHRGSSGWRDWIDNYNLVKYGKFKSTDTYNTHQDLQKKIDAKYGKENISLIGHSRGGKYVEELNKENPGYHEVITFNKATNWSDIGRKNPSNQYDIRVENDPVSSLYWTQKYKNKPIIIDSDSLNPFSNHTFEDKLDNLNGQDIGRPYTQPLFEKEDIHLDQPLEEKEKEIQEIKEDTKKEEEKKGEEEVKLNTDGQELYTGGSLKSLPIKQLRDFLRKHHRLNKNKRKAYNKIPKKEIIKEIEELRRYYS